MSTKTAVPKSDQDWMLFNLDLDLQQVQWLHLPPQQRTEQLFLDKRLLSTGLKRLGTPLPEWRNEQHSAKTVSWIFHVGHCGSTLIANLLGTAAQLQALKEPQVFRELTAEQRELRLPWRRLTEQQWHQQFMNAQYYLSRHLDADEQLLIKMTSDASTLLMPLVKAKPADRILLLNLRLPVYLATMLRSPQHRADLRGFVQGRLQDLLQHCPELPVCLPDLNDAGCAALIWLSHQINFIQVQRVSSSITMLDFDQFLEAPQENLQVLADRFEFNKASPAAVSEQLTRYAKAPANAFSTWQRARALQRSAEINSELITQASRWLTGLIEHYLPEQSAELRVWL